MTYILSLFTPETWAAFREHGAKVSGFRARQRRIARKRIKPGDVFLCYLVRLSRWCGALEVTSEVFEDDTPIFGDPDPFVVRFQVKPLVSLEPEQSLPIFEPEIWNKLTETRDCEEGSVSWTGFFRSSLRPITDADGALLMSLLETQSVELKDYRYTMRDRRQLARKLTVRTLDREVAVEVPGDEEDEDVQDGVELATASTEGRRSSRMQAKIAQIGAAMGFRIWVPRNDRLRVLEHVEADKQDAFIDVLPLNYDDTTLRTIEQIDVLWLKGRSMARAFEVEDTTAVYSGLLRMADLLALQPNMDIQLHIVAPDERREKVMGEIKRPVFSLLERGPLYEKCTFLSYQAIDALTETPHLTHMSDSILEEYEEPAEE
jgi:hypothetical protein